MRLMLLKKDYKQYITACSDMISDCSFKEIVNFSNGINWMILRGNVLGGNIYEIESVRVESHISQRILWQSKFIKNFAHAMGADLEVELKVVDHFQSLPNGKYPLLISRIDHGC